MERLPLEKSVPLDTNCDVLRDGHASVAADASVLHPVKEIQDKVRWFFCSLRAATWSWSGPVPVLDYFSLLISCPHCRGIIDGASSLL